MNALRHHLRFATWLALIAIVAMALLPTLSHALARQAGTSGAGFTEVCTPQGTKLVALADGQDAPDSAMLQLEHCSWCSGALGNLAPLPAAPRYDLPVAGADFVPAPFLHAPTTLHAWASAQPRAPPALS